MNRLRLSATVAALAIVFALPAVAQDPGEFVVRVPGIEVPGLEPNPQGEVELGADLTRTADDQTDTITADPEMANVRMQDIAARCEVIMSNSGGYSADVVALCEVALAK